MTRLLIIKPSSLGDIVHGLQLVTTLHRQRPDLRIDWVARDLFAPLVAQCPLIERAHVFARRGGVTGFWRLLQRLRETRYDVVFDLQGLLRSGLMTAAARAPVKVGRRDAREGAGLFYRRRVALPPAGHRAHALDILLQFAPLLEVAPTWAGPLKFRPFEGAVWAARLPNRPVVLFPDSRRPEKCWPAFAELTEHLLRHTTKAVVWAGSVPQTANASWSAERFANLTGQTPLAALPELIGRAGLVVGNDSGPMHLAAAMDVPVVALFGPTDPARYGPYPVGAPGRVVVRAPGGRLADLSVPRVAEVVERELAFPAG